MFNIYITYFKNADGTINSSSSETLMFTIPRTIDDFPINNPLVKSSENSADSFDFVLEKNSPYFESLIRLKTRLRVEYDGDTIFYGRVLTIGDASFFGKKNVHCEGAYSFFNDTYYEGVPAKDGKKTTWSDYYNKIFQNHNDQISLNDPWKVINRGTVDFVPVNEERKFDPSSWSQTISLFNTLTSTFGGHVRTRYTNGASYLDWYKYYWRDLGDNIRPSVEIGKNILDISSDNKVDNVFTRVIPIGDTDHNGKPIYIDGYIYTDKNGQQHTHSGKYFPVTLMCNLFTQQQLTDEFHSYYDYENAENDHGVVYKTQQFSDANTQQKLWNYLIDWIKKSYFGVADSFTVKAVDLHVIDNSYPKILCGECVDVKYFIIQNGVKTWITKKLICKSAQYDLFNPANNTYIFGIPSDLLTHNYTEQQKKKQDASAAGGGSKLPPGYDPDAPVTFRSMAELIGTNYTGQSPYVAPYYGTAARNSMLENGPLSTTVTLYDPEETNDPVANPDKVFNVEVLGRITLSGYDPVYVAVCEKGACAFRASTRHSWGYLPAAVDLWYFKKNGTKFYSSSAIVTAVTGGTVAGLGIIGRGGLGIKTVADSVGASLAVGAVSNLDDILSAGLGPLNPKLVLNGSTGDTLINGTAAGIRIKNSIADKVAVAIGGFNSKITIKDTVLDKMTVDLDGLTSSFKLRNAVEDKDSIVADGSSSKLDIRNPSLNKDTIEFDGFGEKALIGLGINGTDFRVKINEPASYTDESGTSHSNVRGFVIAEDLKLLDDDSLRSIDSFKSDRIVTKNLIAGRATIGQLNALEARIHTLLADYVLTTYLEANYVKADAIDSNRILISKSLAVGTTGSMVNLYNGTVQANTIQVNSGGSLRLVGSGGGEYYDLTASNIQGFIKSASVDPTTNTLTLTPVHGDPINFRKASATTLTGSWGSTAGSRNVYTVEADDPHVQPISVAVNSRFDANMGMYYIESYQSNHQSGALSIGETSITYQLGLSGTNVQLQYPNGEQIGSTPVYNIGSELAGAWSAAYEKVVLPSANTSSAFITVKTPASTSTGGTNGQNTNEYYITADDTHAYIRSGSTIGTIVAQSSIAGWAAAYNQVELPSTEGSTASIIVKTPASSSSASSVQVSTTYTMSSLNNNTVQLKNGSVVVARFSHNKYIEGQNAVTINKGSWSGGQVTFDKSDGTASTKGVKVGLDGSWSGNTYSYTIKDYYDNAQGITTGYTGTIDATNRYNAGVTAGTTAGQNAVTINKGSWSGGQVTFDKSDGTASTKGVKVGLDGSWSGNTYSYTIKDYYDNAQGITTGYTGTIDATNRYNAGVTAGWSAAYGKVELPNSSDSNTNNYFTIKTPASTSTGGTNGQNSTNYYLTVDNSYARVHYRTANGNTVIRVTNNGWSNACNAIVLPSAGTTNKMQIKIPDADSPGVVSTITYRITVDNDYAYIKEGAVGDTVIARNPTSSVYISGQNSVTITKGSWSGGEITFNKSAGTASTKGVRVGLSGSWSGNTYSYTIKDYYDNAQGVTTGYTGTINAPTITPSSAISINSPTWYNSGSSMPSVDATLSTMGGLIKKSQVGYVYFNVTISGVSGRKVYRIPIDTR